MSVSLKITGTKRKGEAADLVAAGERRFRPEDMTYKGAGGVTDFIVVRHLPELSTYTLVTTNVVTADGATPGKLMVSVAIPAGEYVENLLGLLLELSGAYKSLYMSFDNGVYRFGSRSEAVEDFASILARYPAVAYTYRHVAMGRDVSKVAYIYMTPEQIEQLLADPGRPEFAPYGQVVLVPVADPTVMESTIAVAPKIWRNYRIFINGRESSQQIADPNKTVNISISETPTTEATSVSFTIATARSGAVKGVVADDHSQIIYVKIQPKPKPTTLTPAASTASTAPHAEGSPADRKRPVDAFDDYDDDDRSETAIDRDDYDVRNNDRNNRNDDDYEDYDDDGNRPAKSRRSRVGYWIAALIVVGAATFIAFKPGKGSSSKTDSESTATENASAATEPAKSATTPSANPDYEYAADANGEAIDGDYTEDYSSVDAASIESIIRRKNEQLLSLNVEFSDVEGIESLLKEHRENIDPKLYDEVKTNLEIYENALRAMKAHTVGQYVQEMQEVAAQCRDRIPALAEYLRHRVESDDKEVIRVNYRQDKNSPSVTHR